MKIYDVMFDHASRLVFDIIYPAVKRDEKNQTKDQKKILKRLIKKILDTEL